MYELVITPKICTEVSSSARRFIGAVAREVETDPKLHEYLGVSTFMPQVQKSQITRHPYFSPTANINTKDEEVARFIHVA